MKIRLGFVSNSSSSSFVCSVCGAIESGMDASLSDFGMVRCEYGHDMCESCVPGMDEDSDLDTITVDGDEHTNTVFTVYSEDEYDMVLRKEKCPICTMDKIEESLEILWLRKKLNMTDEEVSKAIKTEFKTYEDFKHTMTGVIE